VAPGEFGKSIWFALALLLIPIVIIEVGRPGQNIQGEMKAITRTERQVKVGEKSIVYIQIVLESKRLMQIPQINLDVEGVGDFIPDRSLV
jgi:hypothetical protein